MRRERDTAAITNMLTLGDEYEKLNSLTPTVAIWVQL